MKKQAVIADVLPDSIADELGLLPGDIVCAVNGRDIVDFLDYQFLTSAPEVLLTVQKQDLHPVILHM